MRLARTLLCLMLLVAASLTAAEERQRFILVMQASAMGINLSPWLDKFGKPAEAEIQTLPALNMMILSLPSRWQVNADALCPHLAQLPEVKSCMADVMIRLQQAASPERLRAELDSWRQCKPWYLGAGECHSPNPVNVNVEEAWTHSRGEGVVVAVFDNGFDFSFPHIADNIWSNEAEIQGRVGVDDDGNHYIDDWYGWDAIHNDGIPANLPCGRGENPAIIDFASLLHGTHAAQFVASANQGRHISGVAWNAKLMSVRIANCNGIAFSSALMQAVDYVLSTRRNGVNIRVINFSYAFFERSMALLATLDRVFRTLASAGITVVQASGNEDARLSDRLYSRAANLIMVGGVDRNGGWRFNWHPVHVDISAPAYSLPVIYYGANGPSRRTLSGTSYAAPMVAGALAMLYAQRPNLSHQQVRSLLLSSATALPRLRGRNAANGMLNVSGMFARLPGLEVDFPARQRDLMEGLRQSFTVRLSRVDEQAGSSLRVPVRLRSEGTSGVAGPLSFNPQRFVLTREQPSRRVSVHPRRDGVDDPQRQVLLQVETDAGASAAYAGASRSIPLRVINNEYRVQVAVPDSSLYEDGPAKSFSVRLSDLPDNPSARGMIDLLVSAAPDDDNRAALVVHPSSFSLSAERPSQRLSVRAQRDGILADVNGVVNLRLRSRSDLSPPDGQELIAVPFQVINNEYRVQVTTPDSVLYEGGRAKSFSVRLNGLQGSPTLRDRIDLLVSAAPDDDNRASLVVRPSSFALSAERPSQRLSVRAQRDGILADVGGVVNLRLRSRNDLPLPDGQELIAAPFQVINNEYRFSLHDVSGMPQPATAPIVYVDENTDPDEALAYWTVQPALSAIALTIIEPDNYFYLSAPRGEGGVSAIQLRASQPIDYEALPESWRAHGIPVAVRADISLKRDDGVFVDRRTLSLRLFVRNEFETITPRLFNHLGYELAGDSFDFFPAERATALRVVAEPDDPTVEVDITLQSSNPAFSLSGLGRNQRSLRRRDEIPFAAGGSTVINLVMTAAAVSTSRELQIRSVDERPSTYALVLLSAFSASDELPVGDGGVISIGELQEADTQVLLVDLRPSSPAEQVAQSWQLESAADRFYVQALDRRRAAIQTLNASSFDYESWGAQERERGVEVRLRATVMPDKLIIRRAFRLKPENLLETLRLQALGRSRQPTGGERLAYFYANRPFPQTAGRFRAYTDVPDADVRFELMQSGSSLELQCEERAAQFDLMQSGSLLFGLQCEERANQARLLVLRLPTSEAEAASTAQLVARAEHLTERLTESLPIRLTKGISLNIRVFLEGALP